MYNTIENSFKILIIEGTKFDDFEEQLYIAHITEYLNTKKMHMQYSNVFHSNLELYE